MIGRCILGVFAIASLVGCSQDFTIHEVVVVDDAFQGWELQQIKDAMSAWEINTPATFRIEYAPHALILEDNYIHKDLAIFRVAHQGDANCPTEGAGQMASNYDAQTFIPGHGKGNIITCVNAEKLLTEWGMDTPTYKTVMLHELGHTMGMKHVAATPNDPAALYWETTPPMANYLACKDLAQFHDLWASDYDLAEDCKGTTYTLFHN